MYRLPQPDSLGPVNACVTCNQHKHLHQDQVGLLQPLLVPCHPWPHISVNFVMALPLPCRKIVTHHCGLFQQDSPLPKLPSPKETAQLLEQHIFPLHGLLFDVVFPVRSVFWLEFCKLLGTTHSLSSAFYPQSNMTALHCMTSWDPTSWSPSWCGWNMPTMP